VTEKERDNRRKARREGWEDEEEDKRTALCGVIDALQIHAYKISHCAVLPGEDIEKRARLTLSLSYFSCLLYLLHTLSLASFCVSSFVFSPFGLF